VVSGCGADSELADTQTSSPKATVGTTACLVTDLGGVDDQGFNQTAIEGVNRAASTLGVQPVVLESTTEAEYTPNLTALVDQDCSIIISVGYLLADATATAANANPSQPFTIVDHAYPPGEISANNVLEQVFATDEAAYLAGYLASGMTTTGTVGTFGGLDIPPVRDFLNGFAGGIDRFNADNGTAVELVGWDPADQTGVFTQSFVDPDAGRIAAADLVEDRADIVMPVAGLAGAGAASLASELGPDTLAIIGVDSDQFETDPANRDVYLTSVMKNIDVTTYDAIASVVDGTFSGGTELGTLANDGVGLAPFHAFADSVPADLVAQLEALRAEIIDGATVVTSQ
jgi:basic membrane protein A